MIGSPVQMSRLVRSWTRRLIAGVCVLLLGFQTGCYTSLPFQTELPRTDRVQILLNDAGRVQMGALLGPAVRIVEGAVLAQDSSMVRVLVHKVTTVGGQSAQWTGESVDIPRSSIAGYQARQLSKARSWILAGVVLGALILSITVFGLDGLGGDDGGEPCVGPTCEPNPSIRW